MAGALVSYFVVRENGFQGHEFCIEGSRECSFSRVRYCRTSTEIPLSRNEKDFSCPLDEHGLVFNPS